MTNWAELRDTSGDALEFVAQEMAAAMEESVDLIYGLANQLHKQEQAGSKPQEEGRTAA